MLTDLALGRGDLDKLAELRGDAARVDAIIADPSTHIVGVCGGDVAMADDALADVREHLGMAQATYLIGRTSERTYVAASFAVPPAGFRSLREVGAGLSADEAAVATAAVALDQWHRLHTHCPRCGTPTVPAIAGWERHCPVDGTSHFPRTDPAVIVVITDPEDRLLLARQGTWPQRRFSLVAGYVEPGETAERAVQREVLEEVGLAVGDLTFLGSQPWPFPASLMLCYHARTTEVDFRVDADEIVEAGWWTRAQLAEDVATGALLLPSAVSIARRAIEHWYGKPLREA